MRDPVPAAENPFVPGNQTAYRQWRESKLEGYPERLEQLLAETYADGAWSAAVERLANPYGDGQAGRRIATAVGADLAAHTAQGAP